MSVIYSRTLSVVCVDDDAGVCALVEDVLCLAGCQVSSFSNARAAVEFLRGNSADIAIVDVILPNESGIWLCRTLRAMQQHHELPVICMSAIDDPQVMEEALREGASDYLVKPVNSADLVARVRVLVRLSRLRRECNSLEAQYRHITVPRGAGALEATLHEN